MANIIATLENKNGDTIYPVAGAMASDSITTGMLKNNSVTFDKINFATLDKVDILTGGNTITSTAETTCPLLVIPQSSAAYRPVVGNGEVFDVDIANNKITIKKDAVIKIYGNLVPASHTSGVIQIRPFINSQLVGYFRATIGAYVNLAFSTPIIAAKKDDVITFTVQDASGDAVFNNNTYGLNWITLEQIG